VTSVEIAGFSREGGEAFAGTVQVSSPGQSPDTLC
jgi:hypothetical protein